MSGSGSGLTGLAVAELTVGSLFSGIGGLDLGLERAGMRVIWQSEIDPYACRVLRKHWPEVPNHGNIKEINWAEVERPDVLCGGYPCQPFSTAGKRQGEADPRHLWPWVREAISQLRPRYAILENVRGHLSLGGLTVIGELASIGYDAEWRIVSAASVGANHRRDRIIIVASPTGKRLEKCEPETQQVQRASGNGQRTRDMAYPNGERPHRAEVNSAETGEQALGELARRGSDVADTTSDRRRGIGSLEQSRETVFGRTDYLRGENGFTGWQWWETEPDVGRVAHGVPFRVDRLRGLGNAVVPQVAEVIGRLVMAHAKTA